MSFWNKLPSFLKFEKKCKNQKSENKWASTIYNIFYLSKWLSQQLPQWFLIQVLELIVYVLCVYKVQFSSYVANTSEIGLKFNQWDQRIEQKWPITDLEIVSTTIPSGKLANHDTRGDFSAFSSLLIGQLSTILFSDWLKLWPFVLMVRFMESQNFVSQHSHTHTLSNHEFKIPKTIFSVSDIQLG